MKSAPNLAHDQPPDPSNHAGKAYGPLPVIQHDQKPDPRQADQSGPNIEHYDEPDSSKEANQPPSNSQDDQELPPPATASGRLKAGAFQLGRQLLDVACLLLVFIGLGVLLWLRVLIIVAVFTAIYHFLIERLPLLLAWIWGHILFAMPFCIGMRYVCRNAMPPLGHDPWHRSEAVNNEGSNRPQAKSRAYIRDGVLARRVPSNSRPGKNRPNMSRHSSREGSKNRGKRPRGLLAGGILWWRRGGSDPEGEGYVRRFILWITTSADGDEILKSRDPNISFAASEASRQSCQNQIPFPVRLLPGWARFPRPRYVVLLELLLAAAIVIAIHREGLDFPSLPSLDLGWDDKMNDLRLKVSMKN
ncbi:hypothetical protein MKZ38_006812 [Zalerion maritima]|uniref:Uncharacterized protein n=1 Tax=Zalerion maritima TaxID=339359 RepID=A0AAD5WWQ6_9PEZI|nr:hypothetical protein MKZ38_006812 [Zalerion maritima]